MTTARAIKNQFTPPKALNIKTFSNAGGNNIAFKSLSHPLAAAKMRALVDALSKAGPVALYDPLGHANDVDAFYDLSTVQLAGYYVQNLADLEKSLHGHRAQVVTALPAGTAKTVFVCAFGDFNLNHIRHLIPAGANIVTLDEARIPDDMLTNPRNYLDALNFATNFAFFRDARGHHSRVVTANYWSGYGAKNTSLWLCLFDANGLKLADWRQPLESGTTSIVLDSKEIRARFKLPEFTGTLFIHAIGVAGHDIVKYALDTYGDEASVLSCTHDANAWPSALYAGLPAPKANEKVTLWIENSSPCAIPAGAIGLNLMGSDAIVRLDHAIPAYGVYPLNVANLLPTAQWPQQIEIHSGMYFGRPRYEVSSANGRQRLAHVNVERSDLKPDPGIQSLGATMGKGYILCAPILPLDRYRTFGLPTPMSTAQTDLPLALLIYDATGKQVARHETGKLPRHHSTAFDMNAILRDHGIKSLDGGFGHAEFIYDFANGGHADGWLHGLFRYEDTKTGHTAETSFGSHIFNTMLVYKNEPQSYAGKPPGLSARLFLRLGPIGTDTICHLIYPASTPWHATSQTDLTLYNAKGEELAKRAVQIPCSGSLLWRASEMFAADEIARAGEHAYVMIRDTTCRLFGYHGLMNEQAFSLDHMFGF